MKARSITPILGLVSCAFVQLLPAAEAAKFQEKVLWSFGSGTDGHYPSASLINVKGMLYGTTSAGGAGIGCSPYGCGTVFAVDPKTSVETVVYSFCSRRNCADGEAPYSNLIDVKSTLYGTTFEGGSGFDAPQFGAAFALNPNTGTERVIHSFCSQQDCTDGANPVAGLINVNGIFYGTTETGGTSFYGTAFALDPKAGTETVLYSFCTQQTCADGQNPNPALVDVNGTLYGTTVAGGAYSCGNGSGCGTAFSLDPNTRAETVLHSFGNGGSDGRAPEAALIVVNGLLYGTTDAGGLSGCGAYGCGTVFSIDPNTGAEKVLYAFCSHGNCTDGANPFASLIAVDGLLYGTTQAGGHLGCGGGGCGTVFSVDPNTGAEKVVYSFCGEQNCTDGASAGASLIDVNGVLYGTTYAGGAYGYGTVFALSKKR